jgi:hypothetical protein
VLGAIVLIDVLVDVAHRELALADTTQSRDRLRHDSAVGDPERLVDSVELTVPTSYTQMLWMGLRAKAAYLPG